MKQILKSKSFTNTAFSFGGQIAFLLSNFILFIYMAKVYDQATFGTWALFITTVSICDGFRQGFVQNGLSRLLIQSGFEKTVVNTGAALNFGLMTILSLLLLTYGLISNNELSVLYANGYKVLWALGTLQFSNTLNQAEERFKRYFTFNIIYLISFVILLLGYIYLYNQPSLSMLINLICLASIPHSILLFATKLNRSLPSKKVFTQLFSFGKYASGTNLLSLLFQRVDILMIGYFLGPSAVAIFHFATKIMNYAELPLQALSQVIYPKISASSHQNSGTDLKKTYGQSVLSLFAFVLPIALVLIFFNHTIIQILGNESFQEASVIIILLSIASVFKPWGRVFGLTLDAVGKPRVNFLMLLLSLGINVVLNLTLIPTYGVIGGAIATASAIVITILIGQLKLNKELSLHPVHTVVEAAKMVFKNKNISSWN